MNDTCRINEILTEKNPLVSNSGSYIFYMEENGTLYIVCKQQQVVWSSENSFTGAEGLYLESDGHAVIYKSDGTVIWTFLVDFTKSKAEKLVLQNDGNLVLLANDQNALWTSGSNEKCPAGIHDFFFLFL